LVWFGWKSWFGLVVKVGLVWLEKWVWFVCKSWFGLFVKGWLGLDRKVD